MKWRLITGFPGEHRFFAGEKPGVFIADQSGRTPDTTADGVLQVDPSRPIMHDGSTDVFWKPSRRGKFFIPLLTTDAKRCSTVCCLEEAIWVHRELGCPIQGITI